MDLLVRGRSASPMSLRWTHQLSNPLTQNPLIPLSPNIIQSANRQHLSPSQTLSPNILQLANTHPLNPSQTLSLNPSQILSLNPSQTQSPSKLSGGLILSPKIIQSRTQSHLILSPTFSQPLTQSPIANPFLNGNPKPTDPLYLII